MIPLYELCLAIVGLCCFGLGWLIRGTRPRRLQTWIVPELPIDDAEKAVWREYWETHQERFLQEFDV